MKNNRLVLKLLFKNVFIVFNKNSTKKVKKLNKRQNKCLHKLICSSGQKKPFKSDVFKNFNNLLMNMKDKIYP